MKLLTIKILKYSNKNGYQKAAVLLFAQAQSIYFLAK